MKPLERGILQALSYDARMSFAALAQVLGVSEQTVKRRYDAMVRSGAARVIVMQNKEVVGSPRWLLRLRPAPGEAGRLADLLAAHPDISWVSELAGGTEVAAAYLPPSDSSRDDFLRDRLPRTSFVAEITAQMMVHRYVSVKAVPGTSGALPPAGTARLLELADPAYRVIDLREKEGDDGAIVALDPVDERIVRELERDGRAPYAAIARTVGATPARVTQRVATMLRSGQIYFDIDVSLQALGMRWGVQAYLACTPAAVERVGRALAAVEEVPFVALTTGATNLAASVMFRGDRGPREFLTETLGGLDGITSAELVPVTRQVKLARSFPSREGLSGVPPARPRSR